MSIPTLGDLLSQYNNDLIPAIQKAKKENPNRKKGGIERIEKGKFVESFTRNLVRRAWKDLKGKEQDIETQKTKPISVPLEKDYLKKVLKDKIIANYISKNIARYNYKFKIDVPVSIRGKLVLAIECKAFAENAMLKRILFDGFLVRKNNPQADIVLLQLESQLGGDYSSVFADKIFGSPSSHTLMSYFDYKLSIITLLEGKRQVNRPIHDPKFFKKMKMESLENAYNFLKLKLQPHT